MFGDFKEIVSVSRTAQAGHKPHTKKVSPESDCFVHVTCDHRQMINPCVFGHVDSCLPDKIGSRTCGDQNGLIVFKLGTHDSHFIAYS